MVEGQAFEEIGRGYRFWILTGSEQARQRASVRYPRAGVDF
jgi:hypothetical protein